MGLSVSELQAIIDDGARHGRVAVIPSDLHIIDRPLEIRAGSIIEWAEGALILADPTFVGGGMLHLEHNATRVMLISPTLDGNHDNYTGPDPSKYAPGFHCIRSDGASYVTIRYGEIRNAAAARSPAGETCPGRDPRACEKDDRPFDNGDGIYTTTGPAGDGSNWTITSPGIHGCGRNGISFISLKNAVLYDVEVWECKFMGIDIEPNSHNQNVGQICIDKCNIHDNDAAGVGVVYDLGDLDDNIYITNSNFQTNHGYGGIYVKNCPAVVHICNNYFRNNGDYAIQLLNSRAVLASNKIDQGNAHYLLNTHSSAVSWGNIPSIGQGAGGGQGDGAGGRMAINLLSGCDYLIVYLDGTAYVFKFWDNQGGVRIEVPPGSGQMRDLDQELQQHRGLRSITLLQCPS